MGKKNSTVVYRAFHIMSILVEAYCCGELQNSPWDKVNLRILRDILKVTKPSVLSSLNLLIQWGFIDKWVEGRDVYYTLSEEGMRYYDTHEQYIEANANIDREIIWINKNAK